MLNAKQSIGVLAISFVLALTAATVTAGVYPVNPDTTTTTLKPEPEPTTKPTPKPTPKPFPIEISSPVCETCKQLAFGVKLQIAHVHPYLGLLCQLNTSEMDVQHCIKLIDASVVHLASKPPIDTCHKLGLCKKTFGHLDETFVEL